MIEVSVPASSANLGSGFDAIAVALNIRMRATASANDRDLRVRFSGRETPSHDGLKELIVRGMSLVIEDPDRLAIDVHVENDIPLGVGLGSSAAALLCGAALARLWSGEELELESLLKLVAAQEGHADNASASLYGGLCFALEDRVTSVQRFGPPKGLVFTLVIPDASVPTDLARGALPSQYSRELVAQSIQRAALLGASLVSGRYETLARATLDSVHQSYRAALVPGISDALKQWTSDTAVVISGSGPTLLLLSIGERDGAVIERVVRCFTGAGMRTRVLNAAADRQGLIITRCAHGTTSAVEEWR